MTMITGRFSPLQTVSRLTLSSGLFGMRALRGKRSEWARLAGLANGPAATSIATLWANGSCDERGADVDVLSHRDVGGFEAIDGTILPFGGQSYTVYTPLGNEDRLNPSPRTTEYRCWSLREGLDSRK
jgi:hypothetical protein